MFIGGGDPHLFGFDGSAYDFMGSAGSAYNLMTDRDLQVNFGLVNIKELMPVYKAFIGQMAFITNSGDSIVVDAGDSEHLATISINGDLMAASDLKDTVNGRSFKLSRNPRSAMYGWLPCASLVFFLSLSLSLSPFFLLSGIAPSEIERKVSNAECFMIHVFLQCQNPPSN